MLERHPFNPPPWRELAEVLREIRGLGSVVRYWKSHEEVVPPHLWDYWDEKEPVLEFNQELTQAIAQVFVEARARASQQTEPDLVARLDSLLKEATDGRACIDNIERLEHDLFHYTVAPCLADAEYLPYRQELFVLQLEKLCSNQAERRDLAEREAARATIDTSKEFWTVEELARFRGVKATSIRKEVSEYRRAHGTYPQWARRFPDKQRGFMVKADVYKAMMLKGHVPPLKHGGS